MSDNIRFVTSDGTSKDVRFAVIKWNLEDKKPQQINQAVSGKFLVAEGQVVTSYKYRVKVRETEPDTGYGDIADLRYLYALNNPNGTPSNLLTLTDHWESQYHAMLQGKLPGDPWSVFISGESAWFTYDITVLLMGDAL